MKRQFLFLKIGQENPRFFVEGRARERLKAERPTQAYSRYYEMLKARKQALAEHESPEQKRPRIKQPDFPVKNFESPVIQNRQP